MGGRSVDAMDVADVMVDDVLADCVVRTAGTVDTVDMFVRSVMTTMKTEKK